MADATDADSGTSGPPAEAPAEGACDVAANAAGDARSMPAANAAGDAGSNPEDDPPPVAEDDSKSSDGTSTTEEGDAEKKANQEDDDDGAPLADASADDLLLRAMSHKEDGNGFFKAQDFTSAARSYRKGTNLLKKLNEGNTGDEQVKQLLITLQTNLSMVCFKQGKHRMSRDVAARALEVDDKNVKALYRRAVAHKALGDVDAAKADLKLALKLDPNNVAVKKELVSIKKALEEMKAQEKARLQKAFSKGGGSLLYSDKEEEEKRKAREQKEKEQREAEAKERRKKEWEDECVRRMSSDPPEEAISFEDWDKERKEKEEAEEKARKKAKKEEEDRKREERRKAREAENANAKDGDSDDDDELTEQELAMLRGYKKTSDGRTTSYFNREQTEEEKKMIGCIKPKRLEQSAPTSPSPTASVSSGGGPVGSVWNQSGTTWEERDTTDWCKSCIEGCLLESSAAYHAAASDDATYVAVVKKVSDMSGDASVAIAGGKKRYIYDFHLTLECEILDEGDGTIATFKLRLPDVNSGTANEEELEVDVLAWTKAPKGEGNVARDAAECRTMLVQDVRKSVLRFVQKFNESF